MNKNTSSFTFKVGDKVKWDDRKHSEWPCYGTITRVGRVYAYTSEFGLDGFETRVRISDLELQHRP